MGFVGLLKFALLCIDSLAWPVAALGYPLFASIRAIETGSKHHMKKLVIYWTIFALISLFEFAFVKFIEWIPFWSCIKLMAIFWLVVPRFAGASHAYQIVVRPYLSLNLQAIIDWLNKLKEEEKHRNTQTFLDVAEKYIKENGSEALEKLIASKIHLEPKEADNSQSDAHEPEEKNAATSSEQVKVPNTAQKDKEILEATTEKIESTEAKQVKAPDTALNHNEMLEATDKIAATETEQVQHDEVKEMSPPEVASARNQHPETTAPTKNTQQEWICALCEVTTTSEKTLNAHLQGNRHKSKCESLKQSKLFAEETPSSTSGTSKSNQSKSEGAKAKVIYQQKQAKPKQDGVDNQTFKLYCDVCDVKLISEIDLASHLQGKRHSANVMDVGWF